MNAPNLPARLENAKNPWQGKWKRVLCVCSAGLLRSPTLAWILSNPPYNCNTRACGTCPEYALIPIDSVLVHWADEIVCVNKANVEAVEKIFKENKNLAKKPIYVLSVPDEFETRDPDLIRIIEANLKAIDFPLA